MFVEQRAYEGASYITSLSYQPSIVYQTLCLMALDPPSHSLIHHSVFLTLVQPQAMPLALPLCPELKAHRGVSKDPDSCVSPAPLPTHPGASDSEKSPAFDPDSRCLAGEVTQRCF